MHPKERKLNRRQFLRTSAATVAAVPTAAAILAACQKPGGTSVANNSASRLARPDNPVTLPVDKSALISDGLKPESGPLKLFNWDQYIRPGTVKDAEAALNTKIEVTTFTTMSEAVSKLTNDPSLDYDVFMGVSKDIIGRLVGTGLLRPLNHSYIPTIENVWPSFNAPGGPFWDIGQQYTLPYTVYSTGIGYRIDPTSPNSHIPVDVSNLEQTIPGMSNPYDILWDTTYKGFVHILDDYRESIAMCLLRRGHTDVNTSATAALNQAQADLIDGGHTMNWKADANAYVDVPEAQALVHYDWSGAFAFVPFYYPAWSPRDVIRYWWPANHKGVIGGDHLTILAGGKNPVLSHQFLNFMLDFDNGMQNYVWNGFQPPMKQITKPEQLIKNSPEGVKPYNILPPSLGSVVVTPQEFDQGYQILELTPEVDNQWKQVWEAYQTS